MASCQPGLQIQRSAHTDQYQNKWSVGWLWILRHSICNQSPYEPLDLTNPTECSSDSYLTTARCPEVLPLDGDRSPMTQARDEAMAASTAYISLGGSSVAVSLNLLSGDWWPPGMVLLPKQGMSRCSLQMFSSNSN